MLPAAFVVVVFAVLISCPWQSQPPQFFEEQFVHPHELIQLRSEASKSSFRREQLVGLRAANWARPRTKGYRHLAMMTCWFMLVAFRVKSLV